MQVMKQPDPASKPVRITLMGPDFFGYVQAIRDEFIRRGYPSRFADERHSNSVMAKIAYRLQWTAVLRRQRDRHVQGILDGIRADGTTDVYLINTEVATPDFVHELRKIGVRVHLYMWDSTANKRSFLDILPLVDNKASFEPADCKQLDMTYVPLFAESVFSSRHQLPTPRQEQLVFLGTLHSRRSALLQQVEKTVAGTGLKIRKLLFYHSRVLFALRSLTKPATLKLIGHLRTRSFTKAEIAQAYFESLAVLDIHHPDQEGLTSRTFESLRSGARLVTLNPTIRTLPQELQDRIVLIANVDELAAKLAVIRQPLPSLSAAMDHFLSIERFSEDLLQVAGLSEGAARRAPTTVA